MSMIVPFLNIDVISPSMSSLLYEVTILPITILVRYSAESVSRVACSSIGICHLSSIYRIVCEMALDFTVNSPGFTILFSTKGQCMNFDELLEDCYKQFPRQGIVILKRGEKMRQRYTADGVPWLPALLA